MKFCFEIPEEEIQDLYSGSEFKKLVIDAAADIVVSRIFDEVQHFSSREVAREIISKNKDRIVENVIKRVEEKVSESISRKKEILEITPKVSELSKINKENEEYFIGLIDKAIAKRFK